MLTRAVLRRVAIVWVICLVILSLQPVRPAGTRGRVPKHQIEHVVAFGATAILLMALARRRKQEWIAAAGVVGLATAIEFCQLMIYRMPVGFEWWDVREDSIGIGLALGLIRWTRVRTLLLADERAG